uniref:Uncharacterized protein n=1 Tax=Arundo donax TaxID=35708 RepID=A0A0A8Y659_ARUDO
MSLASPSSILSSCRGCTCSCHRSCNCGRSRRTRPPPQSGPSSPAPRRGRRWHARCCSSPPGQGTSCRTCSLSRSCSLIRSCKTSSRSI